MYPSTDRILESSLYVADVTRSAQFYERVFGFRVAGPTTGFTGLVNQSIRSVAGLAGIGIDAVVRDVVWNLNLNSTPVAIGPGWEMIEEAHGTYNTSHAS